MFFADGGENRSPWLRFCSVCVQCFGLSLSPLSSTSLWSYVHFLSFASVWCSFRLSFTCQKLYGMGTGQQKFSTFGLKTFSGIVFAPSDSLPTACNFGFLYFQTTLSSDVLFNSLFEYTNALMTFLLAPAWLRFVDFIPAALLMVACSFDTWFYIQFVSSSLVMSALPFSTSYSSDSSDLTFIIISWSPWFTSLHCSLLQLAIKPCCQSSQPHSHPHFFDAYWSRDALLFLSNSSLWNRVNNWLHISIFLLVKTTSY